MLTEYRSFKEVSKLVNARLKAMDGTAFIRMWHKTTLELFKYLSFELLW